MKLLLQKNLTSILLEGGSEINSSAFSAGIVDRVYAFICPVLIGGRNAPGPIGGLGFDKIAKAGDISEEEMRNVFNLGIGYCLVVPSDVTIDNMECWTIGEVVVQ